MEVVQSSLEDRGFSEEVSKRIMVTQASSTLKLYASKWEVFENWCLSEDFDPFKTTNPQIADILLYLFHKSNLSFESLKGYRTAIFRTFH